MSAIAGWLASETAKALKSAAATVGSSLGNALSSAFKGLPSRIGKSVTTKFKPKSKTTENTVDNVKRTAIEKFGGFVLSAAGFLWSIILWIVFSLFLMKFVPAIVEFVGNFFYSRSLAVREFASGVRKEVKGKFNGIIFKIVGGTLRFVLEAILALLESCASVFVHVWEYKFSLLYLVSMATFLLLFEYWTEFTFAIVGDASNTVQEVASLGAASTNLALDVFEVALPMYNMAAYSSYVIPHDVFKILFPPVESDAPKNLDIHSGRRLKEAKLVEVQPYKDLGLQVTYSIAYFYDVLLMVQRMILKLVLGLFKNVVQGLFQAFGFIIFRSLCVISGFYCSVAEVFDAILNSFWTKICIFECFPPLPIACSAAKLRSLGVPCDCRGGWFDFDKPGIFRNARCSSNAGRRALVECAENVEGHFVETVNGHVTHYDAQSSVACPHVRRSFEAHTNADNMRRLDASECYDVCALGVSYKVCHPAWSGEHSVIMSGSCGHGRRLSDDDVRARLAVFGNVSSLPIAGRRRMSAETGFASKTETVRNLKSLVGGEKFMWNDMQCDLTEGTSKNAYARAFDTACVMRSLMTRSDAFSSGFDPGGSVRDAFGRRLSEDGVKEMDDKFKWITSNAFHRIRSFMSQPQNMSFFEKLQIVSESEFGAADWSHAQNALDHVRATYASVLNRRLGFDDDASDVRRRDLQERTAFTTRCLPEQYTCPDMRTCVDPANKGDCPPIGPGSSMMSRLRQKLLDLEIFVETIDVVKIYSDIVKCNDGYDTNPSTRPYARSDHRSYDQTGVVFCYPQIAPTTYRLQEPQFSFKSAISSACMNDTGEAFKSCVCGQYRTTIFEYDAIWYDFVTVNMEDRIVNGLTSVQFFLYFFVFSWPFMIWIDYFWSSLILLMFPTAPRWLSHMFGLISEDDLLDQWLCFVWHLGNVAYLFLLILLVYIFYLSLMPLLAFVYVYVLEPIESTMSSHPKELREKRMRQIENARIFKRSKTSLPPEKRYYDDHHHGDAQIEKFQ